MSLELTPDQIAFRDQLRQFFSDKLSTELLVKRASGGARIDLRDGIGELGIFDLFSDSEPNELNGSLALGLVACESGRALSPELLAENLIAGPLLVRLLEKAGTPLEPTVATALLSGQERCSLVCCDDPEARTHGFVPASGGTTWLLQLGDSVGNLSRIADQNEVEGLDRAVTTVSVSLAPAQATLRDLSVVKRLRLLVTATKAMELAGIAQHATALTVEYVKTRRQFDAPIGGFQAVQHKIADMHLQSEAVYALSKFSAWAADNAPDQFEFAAENALLFACETVPGIVEAAIQLHGGIGFTWEYGLHLWLRRARAIEARFMPRGQKLEALARLAASN